jgi:hypothetical protein
MHVSKDAIDRISPSLLDLVGIKIPLDLTSLFETLHAHHDRSMTRFVIEHHLNITFRRR